MNKNLPKGLIFLAIAIILTLSAFAQAEYYADVLFDVKDDGNVAISGKTNYDSLKNQLTSNLTSKKENIWTLDILTQENLSVYYYKVLFPDNAVLSYVKSSSQVRIGDSGGRPFISSAGYNESITLIVQYTIENPETENNIWITIISGLILLVLIFLGSISTN